MKINVEVDLDEFTDENYCASLNELVKNAIKEEILRVVKKDAKYKAYVNKQAHSMLENLNV